MLLFSMFHYFPLLRVGVYYVINVLFSVNIIIKTDVKKIIKYVCLFALVCNLCISAVTTGKNNSKHNFFDIYPQIFPVFFFPVGCEKQILMLSNEVHVKF